MALRPNNGQLYRPESWEPLSSPSTSVASHSESWDVLPIMFVLFFSCRYPLWKAADGRTHKCTVDISQLLFHKNHQCLIYFGLFSKYIISIVQVSGDGARVRTVEDDQHFACFGNNLDQIWTTKDVPDIEKEKS